MKSLTSKIAAVTIGVATLLSAAAWAETEGAQDDWVRVPSTSDTSNAAPARKSRPQGAESAAGHPQRGGDNASVTIVEYSDYQCPFCRKAEASVREVLEKYGDQVRLVYMDFPLPSHRHAMDAAIAARCADEQGQFWAYHDALYANPAEGLSTDALKSTAEQLGLDSATFDTCLDEHKYESAVNADRARGEAAGLRGIPYFIIGSHQMNGAQPASAFEEAIDDELRSR